jgi:hypothetical protein
MSLLLGTLGRQHDGIAERDRIAALRCAGSVVTPADLPQEIQAPGWAPGLLSRFCAERQDSFQAAMGAARGNRTRGARVAGHQSATLYRRLKELGIAVRGEGCCSVSGMPSETVVRRFCLSETGGVRDKCIR